MKTVAGLSPLVSSEQLPQQDLFSQLPPPIRCGPNMRVLVALAAMLVASIPPSVAVSHKPLSISLDAESIDRRL